MLRDKIDKIGYEYLGRQYLYLNVMGDILVFLKECILPDKDSIEFSANDEEDSEVWPYHHHSSNSQDSQKEHFH